ncbi:MAG: GNAT family N-acetyltransferase [Candidatus Bathyarchaeota archaeon]|nr:GNAT family N-acetyltransferase [Candidatus Bathyarchaeota archaeon]
MVLRPFSKRDLSLVQQWSQDPELRKMTGQISAFTPTQAEQWYREMSADPDRLWFTVVTQKDNRVIGDAGLIRMVSAWKCTDIGIIIGEKDAWRQGYGTDTGRTLLHYVFDILRFHRIGVGVVGFHTAALRFWEHLGFKKEGVWRDGYYYNNQYSDFIMMSILEEEYRQQYRAS